MTSFEKNFELQYFKLRNCWFNSKLRAKGKLSRSDVNIVRSLSGKNWLDRDKADTVSISFPVTPKNN